LVEVSRFGIENGAKASTNKRGVTAAVDVISPELRSRFVTIGIATWNRRALLENAVESALSQTYPHIEIVISDDGSSDETLEYLDTLSDPRIKKIRKATNEGLVANYNTCLRAATSEFFLMLNDDDMLLPTAIEKLVTAFINPPDNIPSESVGVAWCAFVNIDLQGNELWTVQGGPPLETTVDLIEGLFNGTRGPICSGIMLRTSDALAVGGYDPWFTTGCEDSDLWGRAALLHKYAVSIGQPLMRYMMRPSGGATANAQCAKWQQAKQREIAKFVDILRERNDEAGARRLIHSGRNTLANITLTVLLRIVGRPGWVKSFARELWRSRRYMFTLFVLKRAIKDSHKLIRLAKSHH
jgi:glycosyltransferase involved in cell wall biosynthesis